MNRPNVDARLDVVGIGSMVLDRMHRTRRILGPNEKGLLESFGADDRISPTSPTSPGDPSGARAAGAGPVKSCIGGVLLNQLGWASLFGTRVGIFGRQADDEPGRLLRAAMAEAGIETHLDLTGTASSLAEIFIDADGERAIYMAAGATAETTPTHVRRDHADFIARGLCLSTEVSQLPLDATLAALQLAHEQGLSTVVDLDILPSDAVVALGDRATLESVLGQADLLKPTVLAARELFPEGDSLVGLTGALRDRYGCEAVVMTDGAEGSLMSDATGERGVAAYSVPRVVDSTGAGDAFLGGLLAGRAKGLGLDEAAKLGNACGAACVEQVGAFPDLPRRAALLERVYELYDGEMPAEPRVDAEEN